MLRGRRGWRRVGSEWHGPCPVDGVGRDTCWFRPGSVRAVAAGCRHCGGRLDGRAFRAHLEAVVGGAADVETAPAVVAAAAPDPRPGRVWGASVAVSADSPGRRYLVARDLVEHAAVLPASVRWLSAAAACRVGCRPVLPSRAAGAILYRFAGPGEADTHFVQMEAVTAAGRRIRFRRGWKRPSVAGSRLAAGRRVFVAAVGRPGAGCWLVEGPVDGLAVLRLARLGGLRLDGAGVHAVAGVPGPFSVRACWADGPLTLAADRDRAGDLAVIRLACELAAAGRRWRVRRTPHGVDWCDAVAHWCRPGAPAGSLPFRVD